MPLADMQEPNPQTTSEEPPTPHQEGYRICIDVTPNGFTVDGPEPLDAEPSTDETEHDETLPDLTTAIKHVLAIYKENPIGEDAHAQLKSGFESA